MQEKKKQNDVVEAFEDLDVYQQQEILDWCQIQNFRRNHHIGRDAVVLRYGPIVYSNTSVVQAFSNNLKNTGNGKSGDDMQNKKVNPEFLQNDGVSLTGTLTIGPSQGSTIEIEDLKTVKEKLLNRIWELSQLLHKDMSYIEGYRDGVSEVIPFLSELIGYSPESSEERK